MKRTTTLLLCLLLLPALSYGDDSTELAINHPDNPAQSPTVQKDTYHVELLVFRNLDTSLNIDDWQTPNLMNTSDAVDLVLPEFSLDKNDSNYCLLPNEKFCLNKEETRLAKQTHYQILLHIAWTQEIADKWHSKPVHIAGGKNYTIDGEFANEIDGTVSISRGKFITLNTDLFFTEPRQTIEVNQSILTKSHIRLPQMLSYHFTQNRRMKAGELNYLDNPNFGILVKITPTSTA